MNAIQPAHLHRKVVHSNDDKFVKTAVENNTMKTMLTSCSVNELAFFICILNEKYKLLSIFMPGNDVFLRGVAELRMPALPSNVYATVVSVSVQHLSE